MDYSLILFIVKDTKDVQNELKVMGEDCLSLIKMKTSRREEVLYYRLGITDYVMKYKWYKRVERKLKQFLACIRCLSKQKSDPSTMNPDEY